MYCIAGMEVADVVGQATAGYLPYCCPPCRMGAALLAAASNAGCQWTLPACLLLPALLQHRCVTAAPPGAACPAGGVPGDAAATLRVSLSSHWDAVFSRSFCGCLQWAAVFVTEELYLEHQLSQQHDRKCIAMFTAYTGGHAQPASWRWGGRAGGQALLTAAPFPSPACSVATNASAKLLRGLLVCVCRECDGGQRQAHCARAGQPPSCATVGSRKE